MLRVMAIPCTPRQRAGAEVCHLRTEARREVLAALRALPPRSLRLHRQRRLLQDLSFVPIPSHGRALAARQQLVQVQLVAGQARQRLVHRPPPPRQNLTAERARSLMVAGLQQRRPRQLLCARRRRLAAVNRRMRRAPALTA